MPPFVPIYKKRTESNDVGEKTSNATADSSNGHLSSDRLNILVSYCLCLATLAFLALLFLVSFGAYTSVSSEDGTSNGLLFQAAVQDTLLTMIVAGLAGGTLCNLRGIFKYYRVERGLPWKFEVPFYIRPFTGALTGLFIFFLGNLLSSALSIDAPTLSWLTLPGRLPYIGVAFIAGFGSQEFMERLKDVAKSLFPQESDNKNDKKDGADSQGKTNGVQPQDVAKNSQG